MKKLLVPVIVLIVILLGGGAYYLSKRQASVSSEGSAGGNFEEQQAVSGPGDESFVGSMLDLLKRNTAVRCTAASTEEGAAFAGTYYVDPSGKRMRIDTETTTESGGKAANIVSHMITEGDFLYSWQEGAKTGMKISTKVEGEEEAGEQAGETTGAQADAQAEISKNFNFTCSPWTLDQSVFTRPSDVTFQDFTETMKQFAAPSGAMDEEKVQDLMKQFGGE